MKQTNIRRNGFIMALTVCALAAGIVGFVAAVPRAEMKSSAAPQAAQPVSRVQTSVFGLQTLARSQTLRLSVVNSELGEPPELSHDGGGSPPAPARARRVTLAFDIYDRASEPPDPNRSSGDGSVRNLQIVRRISRTFNLRPGQAAVLEIDGTRAGDAVGAWVLGEPPHPSTPGEAEPLDPSRSAVSASLEMRQGNSTQFVLPGTTRGFNPQPDPPRER